MDSVSRQLSYGTGGTGCHCSSVSAWRFEGCLGPHAQHLMLAVCPDRSWNCQWNAYMWPLHVTWASSQHGDCILRVSTVRQPGERHITFYDPTSEVMQHHICCIHFHRRKSLLRPAHIQREENQSPPFADRDNRVLQEHVEPEILLWLYIIITGLVVHAWGWSHLGTIAESVTINQLHEYKEW